MTIRSARFKASLVGLVVLVLLVASACSSDEPAPVAAPAPAPAIDTAALRSLVEDAVRSAAPAPSGVTAAEIRSLVEAAVAAAAPEGATPEQIRAMIQEGVASVETGASRGEIEILISKAVADTAASQTPGVSAAEVQKIVSEAIKSIPTAAPVVIVATPEPVAEVGFVLRAAQANPKRGGVVRTAWGATTRNFDTHQGGSSAVLGQAYNSLIRKNPNDGLNSVIPSLATSWEFDSRGLGWTFSLRDGVKWHDGTDFGAEDVKATFDRIINPPEGLVMTPRSLFEAVTKVEALDRLTVRFTLSEPRSWMFDLFNHHGVGGHMNIYSKKSLEENNFDLRKVEIAPGTGAFILKEHLAAERWVWEANPDYWNPELPYVDGVINIHVPSGEDRGTAVITGIADFTWNTGTAAWGEANKRSDIGAAKLSNFGTIQTLWNANKAPFDDIRVRRALSLSVNRHDFSKIYSFASVNPSRWMSPAGEGAVSFESLIATPGYRIDNTEDIAEANRLMAEAGFPNGEGLPVFDLVAASTPSTLETVAPFIADQFSKIGIKVKIRGVERSLVTEELKKDFDFVMNTSFHSPTVNHTPMWLVMWTTNGSQNLTGYSNPEFDQVVADLNKALTPLDRTELWRKGEDLLDQNPPQIVHGFTDHLPVWQNYVKGINIDKRQFTEWGRFNTVWLDR